MDSICGAGQINLVLGRWKEIVVAQVRVANFARGSLKMLVTLEASLYALNSSKIEQAVWETRGREMGP